MRLPARMPRKHRPRLPAAAEGWTMYTSDMVTGTVLPGWEYPANGSALPDGCPVPAAKDNYVIGMSQANKAEPWREAMNSQIAAAAANYPDFEVVFQDAAQDNAKQVSDVENLLTQGIDLLIISPNEAAPLNDIVKQAWDSCVPVIVLDRNLVDPNYSMFIGADNVAIGRGGGPVCGPVVRGQRARPNARSPRFAVWKVRRPPRIVVMASARGLADGGLERRQHHLLAECRLAA